MLDPKCNYHPNITFINIQHDKKEFGQFEVHKKTRPAGLGPATFGFEAQHSIQLSYGRINNKLVYYNCKHTELSSTFMKENQLDL